MPMNELEKKAIRGCFVQLVNDLDPKTTLDYLYQAEQVDISVITKYQNRKDSTNAARDFLLSDVEKCSFQEFRNSLFEDWEHLWNLLGKSFDKVITEYTESVPPGKCLLFAVNTQSSHCIKVNNVYRKVCEYYYNGHLSKCLTMYESVERMWFCSEISNKCITMLSDLFFKLALLYARHLAFGKKTSDVDKKFEQLQRVLPLTSNIKLFENIMMRKMAVAYSIRCWVPLAEEIADDAVCNTAFLPVCKDTIKTRYTTCGVALVHHEHSMTREQRDLQISTLMDIRHMMRSLEQESREEILETEIITYILPGLIMIRVGKQGVDFGMADIKPEDIAKAEDFFSKIEEPEIWESVTSKWKTVFFIGKAKMALFHHNIQRAYSFIEYAEFHANELPHLPFLKENVADFKWKYNLYSKCALNSSL